MSIERLNLRKRSLRDFTVVIGDRSSREPGSLPIGRGSCEIATSSVGILGHDCCRDIRGKAQKLLTLDRLNLNKLSGLGLTVVIVDSSS